MNNIIRSVVLNKNLQASEKFVNNSRSLLQTKFICENTTAYYIPGTVSILNINIKFSTQSIREYLFSKQNIV